MACGTGRSLTVARVGGRPTGRRGRKERKRGGEHVEAAGREALRRTELVAWRRDPGGPRRRPRWPNAVTRRPQPNAPEQFSWERRAADRRGACPSICETRGRGTGRAGRFCGPPAPARRDADGRRPRPARGWNVLAVRPGVFPASIRSLRGTRQARRITAPLGAAYCRGVHARSGGYSRRAVRPGLLARLVGAEWAAAARPIRPPAPASRFLIYRRDNPFKQT